MRRASAYHEAGHAVAAVHVGLRFIEVTIRPGSDSYGKVVFPSVGAMDWSRWATPTELVAIEGNEGVPLETPMAWLEARFLVSWAGPIAEERFTGEWDAEGASEDMEALATFLPLGPDPFPDAREAARAVVDTRWTEIEAVAAGLLERGRLSGDEVRAIVAEE